MKIIDFHTHIYPDKIAKKGSRSISDFYGLDYNCEGSASVLLERGREGGIDRFVLLPVAVSADNVKSINDFTAKSVKEHEEFFGFGTLHADMDDMLGELERIEKLGLKGLKLHPDTQRVDIDDKRLYEVYDAIGDRYPIVIHCGDPRYSYSRPERLKRVLCQFPKLKVVGAHLGGWSMFEKAFECLHDTGCYFDISSTMMFIGTKETARYIHRYGADRILFGSDFPLWDPASEAEKFLSLSISDEEKEKIAFKNALRLLD